MFIIIIIIIIIIITIIIIVVLMTMTTMMMITLLGQKIAIFYWRKRNMGVSINGGTPKMVGSMLVHRGKSHLEMDDN